MKSLWCMKGKNQTRSILDAMRKEVEFLFDREQILRLYSEEEVLLPVEAKAGR